MAHFNPYQLSPSSHSLTFFHHHLVPPQFPYSPSLPMLQWSFDLPMILILLALISFFFLLYFLFNQSQFWHRHNVPGPRPTSWLSGNLDALFFGPKSAVLTLRDWTLQFGPVYGLRCGQTNLLVISDQEMVRQLLVSKFDHFHARLIGPIAGNIESARNVHLFNARGSRWKRLRAIATPAFSVANLKKIMPTICPSIRLAIALMEEASDQAIDIHRHFVEMAFDIIARLVMGQTESQQFGHSNADLAVRAIQRINNNLFDYYAWIFPWFGRNVLHPLSIWTAKWREDPIGVLLAKIAEVVAERKKQRERNRQKEGPRDFIDLFLDAESEDLQLEVENGTFGRSSEQKLQIEWKNCLEEVVMQCFLFVLSGFDTTASSLSQICHRLAWNPKVQAKMQAEIDCICGHGHWQEQEPSYEQLARLKYTECVIKETLRLSPRVITRACTRESMLGRLLLKKGTGIQVDILSLHRDKSVWGENAEEFVPERWESTAQMPSPYYAFGAGPRMCIGMRLALLENKLALAHLLGKFNILRCEETEKAIEFTGQVVLAPKSVTVRLERR